MNKKRIVRTPPDQGAAPELAHLLYTLAMAKDQRAVQVIERAVDKLHPTWEKLTDPNHGLFYYVDSICYVAECMGDSAFIPSLRKLHSDSPFRDRVSKDLLQPDIFEERAAYLELVIARALARCGDKSGFSTLVDYLEDGRKTLVRHARQELVNLAGKDLGHRPEEWRRWIEKKTNWSAQPWNSDPVYR